MDTVDPHLHRLAGLDEVYDIPTTIIDAAPLLARWIADYVLDPVVIGPDKESGQWVEEIAASIGAPWRMFAKERRGDRDVRMQAPDLREFRGRTPVLVDDIVSSGTTMKQALRALREQGLGPAYCLAVHALCTARTRRFISDNSAGFLTSNTIPNAGAAFDVAPLIAESLVSAAAAGAH